MIKFDVVVRCDGVDVVPCDFTTTTTAFLMTTDPVVIRLGALPKGWKMTRHVPGVLTNKRRQADRALCPSCAALVDRGVEGG